MRDRAASPFRSLNGAGRKHTGFGMRPIIPASRVSDGRAIYIDPRWLTLTTQVRKQRGNRCEACGEKDARLHCDHIIELKDGGEPFSPGNVQLLCSACHGKKTAKTKQVRQWTSKQASLRAAYESALLDAEGQDGSPKASAGGKVNKRA